MKIGKVGHASFTIETDDVFCLLDPVFTDKFESGANEFYPPVELDIATLTRRCTLLVISHIHFDHFSVETIARLNRSIPVIYPRQEVAIGKCLERLGFTSAHGTAVGETIGCGSLNIIPTQSIGKPYECGYIFSSKGRSVWAMVDTVVNDGVVSQALGVVKQIDVLLAKYQPVVEEALYQNGLGSDFPGERYGELLRLIRVAAPRCVVPSFAGLRFARDEWLNTRAFPVEVELFVDDIRQVIPDVRVVEMGAGDLIDVSDELVVKNAGVEGVRPSDRGAIVPRWRPDYGIPPLLDHRPEGRSADEVRSRIENYLNETFISALADESRLWLSKMDAASVVWLLNIIFAEAPPIERFIDFRQRPLAWRYGVATSPIKMVTSITASALDALILGERSAYSVIFGDLRVVHRIYEATHHGLVRTGDAGDEPLTRILFRDADGRYLEHELQRLGYRGTPLLSG